MFAEFEDSDNAAIQRLRALIEGQRDEQFIPIGSVRAALNGWGDDLDGLKVGK